MSPVTPSRRSPRFPNLPRQAASARIITGLAIPTILLAIGLLALLGLDHVSAQTDSTAPTLLTTDPVDVRPDGLTVVMSFNESFDETSTPAGAAFTVSATPAGGSSQVVALAPFDAVRVSGQDVYLTLRDPLAHNHTGVTVSYTKPGSNPLRDPAGNEAANITNQAATNSSAVPVVAISVNETTAVPFHSDMVFEVTRSNADDSLSLPVEVEFTQTDAYLESSSATISILQGSQSVMRRFGSAYTGNVSGTVVARIVPTTGYVVSSADSSVQVSMNVPAAGNAIVASLGQATYNVTEGESPNIDLSFETSMGRPRETISVSLIPDGGDAVRCSQRLAAGCNSETKDYHHWESARPVVTIAPGDWTSTGTAHVYNETFSVRTLDDSRYEGTKTVEYRLDAVTSLSKTEIPGTCSPGGERSPGVCVATVNIGDNEMLAATDVYVVSTLPPAQGPSTGPATSSSSGWISTLTSP